MSFVDALIGFLRIFVSILFVLSTIVIAYNMFLSVFGFKKATRNYTTQKDESKFLILIAAHNEEAVIASTVENLRKINYDTSLFDIYVINDNSVDGTEKECQRINANYINTSEKLFPKEGVGKPAAIQYALRYLGFEKLKEQYDLVLVLDADNHVDPHILTELNSQYICENKPTAIQTYLDSKNYDKFLSLGYCVSYFLINRFTQLSKSRLNLPAGIGGTGFVVRADYLINSGGFNYKSLTEDIEMEIEIVKDGGRVIWNHFARVYDEKPDNIKISLKQRTRWMQGHWYIAYNNLIPLTKLFFKERKLKYFDQMMYASNGFMGLYLLTSIVFGIIVMTRNAVAHAIGAPVMTIPSHTIMAIISYFFIVYSLFVQVIYAIKADTKIKVTPLFYIKCLIALEYYSLSFLYPVVKGLIKFKQQGVWVKTEHKYKTKRVTDTSLDVHEEQKVS